MTTIKELNTFNPDWKCKPNCTASEVVKEWLEYGLAPKKDIIRAIELAEDGLRNAQATLRHYGLYDLDKVEKALSEIRKLKGD